MALPGIREIEIAGLEAWPAIEVEHDGAWVRRAAGGYTRRANSVQCLDPADSENASARIADSRRWFESRRLMPVFRVTPLTGPRILRALDEAGWRAVDTSRVLVMDLVGRRIECDRLVETLAIDDRNWLSAQCALQRYDVTTCERLAAITSVIRVPARGLLLRSAKGHPIASALMSVADGIVVAGNVMTAPSERGKGYGSAVMRSGLVWAMGAGAGTAALNVQADNAAGLALYASVGYAHFYDYHYRVLQG